MQDQATPFFFFSTHYIILSLQNWNEFGIKELQI